MLILVLVVEDRIMAVPIITSILPDIGKIGEYVYMTVTGSNLTGIISMDLGADIYFAGWPEWTEIDDTTLETVWYIDPSAAFGFRTITVENADGSGELVDAFIVTDLAVPTLISATPSEGKIGEYLQVFPLQGTNLTGVETSGIDFGADILVDWSSVDNDNQINVWILIDPAAVFGLRTITVSNIKGTATLVDGFEVVDIVIPVLTSIDPVFGSPGEEMWIYPIVGSNLTGVTAIDFGAGIIVSDLYLYSDTEAEVYIIIDSLAVAGFRTITATNPKGAGILVDGFEVLVGPPVVTSVSPSYGDQGASLTGIVIMGANFTGATDVSFGANITTDSFSVVSDTEIHADISIALAAADGLRTVSVTTPIGLGFLASAFMVFSFPYVINSSSACIVVLTGHEDTYVGGGFIGDAGSGVPPQ